MGDELAAAAPAVAATEETREVESPVTETVAEATTPEATADTTPVEGEVTPVVPTEDEITEAPVIDDGAEEDEDEELVEDLDTLASLVAGDPQRAAKELKKLRAQAAANRNIDSALASADEDFREGWLTLADLFLSEDPADKAEAARVFAELSGTAAASTDDATTETDEPAEPVNVLDQINQVFDRKTAELVAEQERREQQLAATADQAAVDLDVKALGYDAAEDPETHALFWSFVKLQDEGAKDLTKAHESVQAYHQKILDRKLEELKAANTGTPVISGTGSASVEAAREAEAKKLSLAEQSKQNYLRRQGKA
jgi:hypothetical protein